MRVGIISQIDAAGHRARVQFPEADKDTTDGGDKGLETYWFPVVCQWSTGSQAFCMPTIGEQVVCLMDENADFGVILGGIYNSEDTPPDAPETARYHEYPDGTIIQYDPDAHELTADVKGDVILKATGDLTAEIDGDATLKADGKINVESGSDMTLKATGKILLQAPNVETSADFKVGGNELVTGTNPAHHTHPVVGAVATAVP
jgi:phage baseplate assembly protein V